ncbi:DUF456 domain-containing protein [Telluribacter sp.]|jgi:hypothetical protein|uniref:DUF456 domain-containing protein n=1 Tax=Telluribacter sp. TaxID=1978767 RepID=UPI002E0E0741|nr:DUF456 domain-containing protein [Telluribacter sp.]
MDTILLVLGLICLFGGLAGAVLPTPGPSLSFGGLLLLHFSSYTEFSTAVLVGLGLLTVLIAALDYFIPIWGAKKFGGTRYGSIGAVVGLVIGFFVLPGIGIFLGTFLGALFGELIGGSTRKVAFKAALGSFLGFLTGMVMEVILCLIMIGYAVVELAGYFGDSGTTTY